MLLRPWFFVLGLSVAAVLAGCGRQGEGGSCSTYGNDCQSGLTCQTIAGYENTGIGKCCMPNTECGNNQTQSILNQDADTGDESELDAGTSASDADSGHDSSIIPLDAHATEDASDAAEGGG